MFPIEININHILALWIRLFTILCIIMIYLQSNVGFVISLITNTIMATIYCFYLLIINRNNTLYYILKLVCVFINLSIYVAINVITYIKYSNLFEINDINHLLVIILLLIIIMATIDFSYLCSPVKKEETNLSNINSSINIRESQFNDNVQLLEC